VPLTLESLEKNINDVAGIRVVCPYIDDIYKIADALLSQDDVTLITKKDYIEKPKPNGYRSLHLIISIPVFFESGKKDVRVEVQIRTIAMDFWASLEHQIKYKRNIPEQESVSAELKQCADLIAETDVKMLNLRNKIDIAEDVQSDNDLLKEKLRKFDI
jgi:putative GTP pyrophosphokinase